MKNFVKLFEGFTEESIEEYAQTLPAYRECLDYGFVFKFISHLDIIQVTAKLPVSNINVHDDFYLSPDFNYPFVMTANAYNGSEISITTIKKKEFTVGTRKSYGTRVAGVNKEPVPHDLRHGKSNRGFIEWYFTYLSNFLKTYNNDLIQKEVGFTLKHTSEEINDQTYNLRTDHNLSSAINDLWG